MFIESLLRTGKVESRHAYQRFRINIENHESVSYSLVYLVFLNLYVSKPMPNTRIICEKKNWNMSLKWCSTRFFTFKVPTDPLRVYWNKCCRLCSFLRKETEWSKSLIFILWIFYSFNSHWSSLRAASYKLTVCSGLMTLSNLVLQQRLSYNIGTTALYIIQASLLVEIDTARQTVTTLLR